MIYYNSKGKTPPKRILESGRIILNPGLSSTWREANGYILTKDPTITESEDPTITESEDPTITEPISIVENSPKHYSQLAIIRALGSRWAIKRAELEAMGFLDQFFAADYLSEDDPVFSNVFSTLSGEEKNLLDNECVIP